MTAERTGRPDSAPLAPTTSIVGETPLIAVVLFDRELRITLAEGLGLAALGSEGIPQVGGVLGEVLLPRIGADLVPACESALRGESRVLHLAHPTRRIRALVRPVREGRDTTGGGLLVTLDVTDAAVQAARVQRSESDYRALVEHAAYGIYRSTPDGRFLAVNPALVRMLGYDSAEELLSVRLDALYTAPGARDRLIELERAQEDVDDVEVQWRRKDGREITVRLTGRTVYDELGRIECFEKFVEDVTERRTLEAQLRQAQKMEAIGQLVGGIAHDFNNVLTTVMGNAEFVLESVGDRGTDAGEAAADIRDAAASGAALVRKMMTVSRKEPIAVRPMDLAALTSEVLRMARRLLPANIELETHLPDAPSAARIDRGAVEQILLNLLTNARDAMPAGGRLTVGLAPVGLSPERRKELRLDPQGRYLCLSVRDTGTGMDTETLTRVFEPFFTTKPAGSGTGLGLAMVYGLMQQHRGAVRMESTRGVGTTVRLYFPAGASETSEHRATGSRTYRGEETLLLVDDNDEVRVAAARLLERSGYDILQAADGEEAIRILQERKDDVALVLTDVMMPKVGGRGVYEAVLRMDASPSFLFCSGYLRPTDLAGLEHDANVGFLPKPWSATELTRAVRRMLDGQEPRSGPSVQRV